MTQNENQTLQDKIIRQVEYYFGDANLARDKFLNNELGKEDGWVEIATLLTFNRLKSMTEDAKAVVDALRESKSGLLEVNEEGSKVRRVTPLPDFGDTEYRKELKKRTLHIKGFPKDATLDAISEYCAQYGKPEQVTMRRLGKEKDHAFKGCIFVIYATLEDAKKALEGQEKFQDQHKLLREDKEAYFARKMNRNIKRNKKLVKLNDENEAEGEASDEPFESGCVLKLKGISTDVKYSQIKEEFVKHDIKVDYVDINAEKSETVIRFLNSTDLQSALEKIKIAAENEGKPEEQPSEGEKKSEEQAAEQQADSENLATNGTAKTIKVNVAGVTADSEVMTGEEEVEYWRMVRKIKSEYLSNNKGKSNHKHGKGGKRKGNFGHHGNKQKRVRAED